jgi:hypothetical protein
MPEYDTVVAITSGTGDLQGVLNLVWDRILPALGTSALPPDEAGDERLSAKLATLSLRLQSGERSSPTAASVSGRVYRFPPNSEHVETISLNAAGDRAAPVLTFRLGGREQQLECGQGGWAKGAFTKPSGARVLMAVSGAWSSEDTFSVRVVRYQTPFSTDYDLRFAGDQLILEAQDNVGFTAPPRTRIVGTAQP